MEKYAIRPNFVPFCDHFMKEGVSHLRGFGDPEPTLGSCLFSARISCSFMGPSKGAIGLNSRATRWLGPRGGLGTYLSGRVLPSPQKIQNY
eukprot:3994330-Amphidinium_carterae.1